MRNILVLFALAISGCGCTTSAFDLSEDNICQGLLDLAVYGQAQQQAIEVVLIKDGGEIGCGYYSSDAIKTFCKIVLENSSSGFINGYPWAIRSCVSKNGSISKIQTTNDWSGLRGYRRKKIVEIKGELILGIELALFFEPYAENNSDNYYGRYNLTLTPHQTD